jgi:amicoumacin kinase
MPDAEVGERLPSGENDVYRVRSATGESILRLTPLSHRSRAELEAELDFVRYLCENGYPAAAPIADPDGAYLIAIEDGHAALFELAPGEHVEAFGPLWTEPLFVDWGRSIGRLHNLSATYPRSYRRFGWEDEATTRWMPANLKGVARDAYHALLPKVRDAADEETLIIHGDFGRVNFHLQNGQLIVFDFDDCTRHVPMYDIAVALWPLRNRPPDERDRWLSSMLIGYEQERPASTSHLQTMFEWRTLYMLAHHTRKWGSEATGTQSNWLASVEAQIVAPTAWSV